MCKKCRNIFFFYNILIQTYEIMRAIFVIFCISFNFIYFINYYLLVCITYWLGPVCICMFFNAVMVHK